MELIDQGSTKACVPQLVVIAALVAFYSASKALPYVVGLFPQQDSVYSFGEISKLELLQWASPKALEFLCVIVCMPVPVLPS